MLSPSPKDLLPGADVAEPSYGFNGGGEGGRRSVWP